jgi:hypothetical protein
MRKSREVGVEANINNQSKIVIVYQHNETQYDGQDGNSQHNDTHIGNGFLIKKNTICKFN